MVGYKVYFNGTKFVVEESESEVCSMPGDSTTEWYEEKKYADKAADDHNKSDLKDVIKCKECGSYFWQNDDERKWYTDNNLKIPRRCDSCRRQISTDSTFSCNYMNSKSKSIINEAYAAHLNNTATDEQEVIWNLAYAIHEARIKWMKGDIEHSRKILYNNDYTVGTN